MAHRQDTCTCTTDRICTCTQVSDITNPLCDTYMYSTCACMCVFKTKTNLTSYAVVINPSVGGGLQ